MMHATSADTGWIVLALVIWALVVAGALWLGVHLVRRPRPRPTSLPSPLDILEHRYAAGQISREDFDEARARLREHDLDT